MTNRILGLIIISILLIMIDFYILKALKSVKWRWKPQKYLSFYKIWWGYTIILIIGVFISIFFNIKFLLRAIILVMFFLTFVSKIFILPFLVFDDLRRGFIWTKRKLATQSKREETDYSKKGY